jgi:hypothetical protein
MLTFCLALNALYIPRGGGENAACCYSAECPCIFPAGGGKNATYCYSADAIVIHLLEAGKIHLAAATMSLEKEIGFCM